VANTILVIDDEQDLLDLVAYHLQKSGFEVLIAHNAVDGMGLASRKGPDLILLDVMLPDLKGTDVLKELRARTETAKIPVVLLTACGAEIDRVLGFELGADDYVVKPFSPRELVLRLTALLKRAGQPAAEELLPPDPEGTILVKSGIRLDQGRFEVRAGGRTIPVTTLEFRILALMMQRAGRVVTRDDFLERVWGRDVYVTDRTVDVHIKRLRNKLGANADRIQTIRGVGYRFQG
jgi:two-component system phosphate regulon response regulator PhoB